MNNPKTLKEIFTSAGHSNQYNDYDYVFTDHKNRRYKASRSKLLFYDGNDKNYASPYYGNICISSSKYLVIHRGMFLKSIKFHLELLIINSSEYCAVIEDIEGKEYTMRVEKTISVKLYEDK